MMKRLSDIMSKTRDKLCNLNQGTPLSRSLSSKSNKFEQASWDNLNKGGKIVMHENTLPPTWKSFGAFL